VRSGVGSEGMAAPPVFEHKTAFGTSTTQRSPVRPFESVPSDVVRGARKVARDASASAAMPVPVVGDAGCEIWGHVLSQRQSGDAGTVGRQRVRGDGRRRRVQRLRPRPRFGARRGRDHLADLAEHEGGGVRLRGVWGQTCGGGVWQVRGLLGERDAGKQGVREKRGIRGVGPG
jgi:hypothetical protein